MQSPVYVCEEREGLVYSVTSVASRSSGGLLRDGALGIGMHVRRTKSRVNHAPGPLCSDTFPNDVVCESTCDVHPCGLKVAVSGAVLAAAYEAVSNKETPAAEEPMFFSYDGKGLVRAEPVCPLTGGGGKECDLPPDY